MESHMAERFERLTDLHETRLDRDATLLLLADIGIVRAFLDHVEARLAGHLASRSPTAELDHARATRTSASQAARARERHRVAGFGLVGAGLWELLAEGRSSAAHLDRYARARALLPDHLRHELDHSDSIIEWAGGLTPDQFSRRVRQLAEHLRRQHGIDSLAEQRAAIRLACWNDRSTGLSKFLLTLDPERAFALRGDLEAMVHRLANGPPIDGCPNDPVERSEFLRAHAFLALLDHGESCTRVTARRELVVVVDTTRGHLAEAPDVTWGHGIEPPLEALVGFASQAQHVTVIDLVRGGVVTTPERLNLGRSSRLASRLQRRALAALHPECGVEGCEVPFARCHIHHVTPWTEGGRTDLANLVPLCSHHHHRAHEQRWRLELDDRRQLCITLPDGRRLERSPPAPKAA